MAILAKSTRFLSFLLTDTSAECLKRICRQNASEHARYGVFFRVSLADYVFCCCSAVLLQFFVTAFAAFFSNSLYCVIAIAGDTCDTNYLSLNAFSFFQITGKELQIYIEVYVKMFQTGEKAFPKVCFAQCGCGSNAVGETPLKSLFSRKLPSHCGSLRNRCGIAAESLKNCC
jgi:hypothetical protein